MITRSRFWHDVLVAGIAAALLSGIPSTLHAWWTGEDVLRATRAAGAMLIAADSTDTVLLWAAVGVHGTISLFWAAVLTWMLPRQRTFMWALVASAGIAVLDLRVIGPLFPEVYALPFWPQFADHLAWGATLGAVLRWRWQRRSKRTTRGV